MDAFWHPVHRLTAFWLKMQPRNLRPQTTFERWGLVAPLEFAASAHRLGRYA